VCLSTPENAENVGVLLGCEGIEWMWCKFKQIFYRAHTMVGTRQHPRLFLFRWSSSGSTICGLMPALQLPCDGLCVWEGLT